MDWTDWAFVGESSVNDETDLISSLELWLLLDSRTPLGELIQPRTGMNAAIEH